MILEKPLFLSNSPPLAWTGPIRQSQHEIFYINDGKNKETRKTTGTFFPVDKKIIFTFCKRERK
jgi:hypothetical protein